MHPHLFHLGPVTVTTYGALAALGLVLAMLLAERDARVEQLDGEAVWNLCLAAIFGTLVLSRIVLIAQSPRSFLHYPLLVLTLPTVTKFGLLASLLCGLGYALYRRLPLLTLTDALSPAAMLLLAFLHLGDFFAGEDIGATTTSIFGLMIPTLRGSGALAAIGTYPVALFSAIVFLLIAVAGLFWLPHKRQNGEVAGATLLLAAGANYLCDLLRPESVTPAAALFGLSLQQYVLLGLILCGGALLMERKEKTRAV